MKNYAVAGIEPALSEVLDDPIVHLLMARDGVTRGNLELLIEWVRQNRLAVQSVASQRQSGPHVDRWGEESWGVALKRDVRPTAASPSIPCHCCEVWNRTFCAGVEPEELHRLDAIATEVNLKPQQNVFFEGDPAGFVLRIAGD
jgi:hypothetical protein